MFTAYLLPLVMNIQKTYALENVLFLFELALYAGLI